MSDALSAATTHFAVIQSLGDGNDQTNLGAIERTFARMRQNFEELNKEYTRLGADNDAGIRAKVREAAADMERVIGLDMSWLPTETAHQLIEALLAMRRYEAAYALDRSFTDRASFNEEFGKFRKVLDGVVAAEILKTQVRQTVRNYVDAFESWIATDGEITSRVAGIDSDAEFLIRSADANVKRSNEQNAQASAALQLSQARTRNFIIGVGLATVVLGLAFGLWIGRTITRPLLGLAGVMQQLADGDTSARIPATRARDEIGVMARAVVVFRDTMIERERLAATQAETTRAREQRGEAIAVTITRIRNVGRPGAGQGPRRGAPPRGGVEPSQQRRRSGLQRNPHRRAPRRVCVRQRDHGRQFGRGARRLDRRDRRAGHPLDRGGRAAPSTRRGAPCAP